MKKVFEKLKSTSGDLASKCKDVFPIKININLPKKTFRRGMNGLLKTALIISVFAPLPFIADLNTSQLGELQFTQNRREIIGKSHYGNESLYICADGTYQSLSPEYRAIIADLNKDGYLDIAVNGKTRFFGLDMGIDYYYGQENGSFKTRDELINDKEKYYAQEIEDTLKELEKEKERKINEIKEQYQRK